MHILDLAAYFARIGYTGTADPSGEALWALHDAHTRAIPFENLDIHLGRPIRLDLPSLERKLVEDRRGGYCFEQNTLFCAVLRQLGFHVTTLAARVRLLAQPGEERPRTHMVLRVELADGPRLCDVGFGAVGLTTPLRLEAGIEQPTRLDRFRLLGRPGGLLLQACFGEAWADLYEVSLEEHFACDYEVASWFTSTHPSSLFVQGVVAARPMEEGRWTLRGGELSFRGATGTERRPLTDPDELLGVLDEHFGLFFPAGTRFGRP